MGKRLFKALISLAYLIIFSSVMGSVAEYFTDGKSDAIHFFPMVFLSLVPIALLSFVQYIIFGEWSLGFLFEKKTRYKWVSGTILSIFIIASLLWGYEKKLEYDRHNNEEMLLKISNDTFYDYNRREHKSFSEEEHKFLFSLVWDNKKMSTEQRETFSKEALSLAESLREKKQIRIRAMIAFAKDRLGCKDENIGVTSYGDIGIRKNTSAPYRVLGSDLIKEDIRCEEKK